MPPISYKSAKDLEKMRAAGRIVSTALAAMRDAVRPGVTTAELDELAHDIVVSRGGHPSFLGYRRDTRVYPASICASVNAEVVHGIPSQERVLQAGDLVKLDIGVRYKGFHADSAITVAVGTVSEEAERLLQVTRDSLWKGIAAIRYRGRLQDISAAVQSHVEAHGFAIVRQMVGHGVGKDLHEEPQIPNYVDNRHPNPRLEEGMTLAIEPMVNAGDYEIEVLPDRWTVVTRDRKLSAHFEHTVAISKRGADVLTLGPHDLGISETRL